MFKALKRWWKYMGAKIGGSLDERADPKVQLEQSIREAQDQHRRLREQAANVIANQKQLEMQLSRTMGELEKANANTRQALMMAQEAEKAGDMDKAREYNQTAEAFANRLIATENDHARPGTPKGPTRITPTMMLTPFSKTFSTKGVRVSLWA